MDSEAQREKKRIDNILSKVVCSYNSPVSLAKYSMNKMKKHKKLFGFDTHDKGINNNIKSEREIMFKPIDSNNNKDKSDQTKSKKTVQQAFTFQTLRELLAANHDLNKLGKIKKSSKGIINKPKYANDSEGVEKNRIVFMPKYNEYITFSGKPKSFLKKFSENSGCKVINFTKDEKYNYQKYFDDFHNDSLNHQSTEIIKSYSIENSENDIFTKNNDMDMCSSNSKKINILQNSFEGKKIKNNLIGKHLPKLHIFTNAIGNKNKSILDKMNEDFTLRGWEKFSGLDFQDIDNCK